MVIQNTENYRFNVTENWIVGITDAEGCFSIQLSGDTYNKFSVSLTEIISLITNIYNVHGDTYRHYSLNDTIDRFQKDWNF